MELEKYFDFFPRKSRKGLPSRLSTVLSPKPFWLCSGWTPGCSPCHVCEGTGSTLGSRATGTCKGSTPGLCSESTGWSLDLLCAMSDSNPALSKLQFQSCTGGGQIVHLTAIFLVCPPGSTFSGCQVKEQQLSPARPAPVCTDGWSRVISERSHTLGVRSPTSLSV